MDKPLILFKPELPKLSTNEREVLDLLVEAGKLIAPVYLEQENEAKHWLSKEEIEKAGRENASVRSPYTVVEKIKGKIVVTPYHIKYAKLLKPIAEILFKASKLTNNKEFGKVLTIQAKALLNGTYDQATIAQLRTKPYVLDISIGPMEHFDNQLFYAKAAYQAWVGVIDIEGTNRLNNYKEITLGVRRKTIATSEHIENMGNVKAKTLDEILLAGLMARTQFVGINLPMNLKLVEKYGSEITIFNQVNDLRMEKQIVPAFNKIFSKEFREGFSLEDLRRGSLRYVALHELAHNYLYYKKASNLEEFLPALYELAATILGFRMAGTLLLKDRITNKQLESMLIAYLCRSLFLLEKSKENKSIINYTLGGAIFVNFMLKNDAIKNLKGLAIPNFMKIFVSLHDLFDILEYLLASGSKKEAKIFIQKYGNLRTLA